LHKQLNGLLIGVNFGILLCYFLDEFFLNHADLFVLLPWEWFLFDEFYLLNSLLKRVLLVDHQGIGFDEPFRII
jgi:hypothetical protein